MNGQDNSVQKHNAMKTKKTIKLSQKTEIGILVLVILIGAISLIIGRHFINQTAVNNANASSLSTKKIPNYTINVTKNSKMVREAQQSTTLNVEVKSRVNKRLTGVKLSVDGVSQKSTKTKITGKGIKIIKRYKLCCTYQTKVIKVTAVNNKGKRFVIKATDGKDTINIKVRPFAKVGNTYSVKNFGAKGNGRADDTVALQKAIDSSKGILQVPPGKYRITKPLLMRSFVRLHGTPGKSVIVNTGKSTENAHIIIGDAHPYAFDKRHPRDQIFTNIPVQNSIWTKGSKSISLSNSMDARRFKIDEIACVRSKKYFDNGDAVSGWAQPDFVQFVRILKIEGTKLIFDDSAINNIKDPEVCKVEGIDPHLSNIFRKPVSWYSVKFAEISGIKFEGGQLGLDRGLCYTCYINNVSFKNVRSPMLLNAILKSTFSDISGDYSGHPLEIKMASSQSVFKDFHFKYISPLISSVSSPYTIDIGERSTNIFIDNMNLDIGSNSVAGRRIVGIGDAQGIQFINSNISVSGGGNQQIFELRGNYNSSGPSAPYKSDFATENYVIANNKIDLGIEKGELAIIVGNEKNWIQNLRFYNNKWTGTRTTNGTGYWAGNYVRDWSVINESIPVATHFRVTHDATHFNEDPFTQNVTFGN